MNIYGALTAYSLHDNKPNALDVCVFNDDNRQLCLFKQIPYPEVVYIYVSSTKYKCLKIW